MHWSAPRCSIAQPLWSGCAISANRYTPRRRARRRRARRHRLGAVPRLRTVLRHRQVSGRVNKDRLGDGRAFSGPTRRKRRDVVAVEPPVMIVGRGHRIVIVPLRPHRRRPTGVVRADAVRADAEGRRGRRARGQPQRCRSARDPGRRPPGSAQLPARGRTTRRCRPGRTTCNRSLDQARRPAAPAASWRCMEVKSARSAARRRARRSISRFTRPMRTSLTGREARRGHLSERSGARVDRDIADKISLRRQTFAVARPPVQ